MLARAAVRSGGRAWRACVSSTAGNAGPPFQLLRALSSTAAAALDGDHGQQEHQQLPTDASLPAAAAKPAPKRRLRRDFPPPITLTERAADRIKELLEAKPGKVGVRLGVKRRGCNGYSYTLNYADEKPAKDEEVAEKGVRVFVDPLATFYIVGTTMDWEETELSSEFTFKNPNAKGSCGCGESFNV